MRTLKRLWHDDGGALIATEFVLAACILVLGVVAGLQAVRSSLNQQLEDTAGAINALDPQYMMSGQRNGQSETAGSAFIENRIEVQIIDGQQVRPKSEPPAPRITKHPLVADASDPCD